MICRFLRKLYARKRIIRRAERLVANIRDARKGGTEIIFIRQRKGGYAGKSLLFVSAYLGIIAGDEMQSEMNLKKLEDYPFLHETILASKYHDEIQTPPATIKIDEISKLVITTTQQVMQITSHAGWRGLGDLSIEPQGIFR